MKSRLPPLSLYIHIPWCIQKCPYCDFNSHAVKSELPESAYITALLDDLATEIAHFQITRPIESIFIGGGTPSLFSAASIYRLLSEISKLIVIKPEAEITLEANPNSVESEKFKAFREAGVNRLSIGIQSFNEAHLKKLGRVHTMTEAINAAEIAHLSGFDNFNLDLMFGLPQQTSEQAVADVQRAIDLNPTHLSLYQLTLEPNTYFHRFPPKLPKDSSIVTMQENCQHLLREQMFEQYEVSAYSKKGSQCQHNLNYWKFGDYIGIGAGAHGKISQCLPNKIYRTLKPKNPHDYLEKTKKTSKRIAVKEIPLEFMMNQLRLKQGFSLEHYQKTTQLSKMTLEPALTNSLAQKLLYEHEKNYFCTEKGWDFMDTLLEKFIS
ncbi:MAG: radical SAM family heme chaperone HemW [Methylococcales bacterium]|nr:radical SAM family heme chaperone HemW [Methylococcales bacterium]